jgi:hypothetical protein
MNRAIQVIIFYLHIKCNRGTIEVILAKASKLMGGI